MQINHNSFFDMIILSTFEESYQVPSEFLCTLVIPPMNCVKQLALLVWFFSTEFSPVHLRPSVMWYSIVEWTVNSGVEQIFIWISASSLKSMFVHNLTSLSISFLSVKFEIRTMTSESCCDNKMRSYMVQCLV